MKIVTIELMLESDDSATIACALDEIANTISEAGYNDSEFGHLRDTNGKDVRYRVIQGYANR